MFKSPIIFLYFVFISCFSGFIFTPSFTTVQAQEAEKTFNAEYFTLDNGLEIVVIPSARVPAITHMVWYKVGAADEPRGKSGIAHFLEHLMFKGSDGLKPGEFSERVRALGGNDNAFTSQDYTAYFQSISAEHLETVMRMEAGRMRGLNPPLEQVTSERSVILEERRQRTDNKPKSRFEEQLGVASYINHPYGTPVIGWAHEMATLSWEDAKSFYDRWYGPNNAILIVSGDVTGKQVYKLAKEIYGPLKPIKLAERNWTSLPPLNSLTNIVLEDESVRQATVQTRYHVPSYRQNKQEALALEVLAQIMGGGPSSRLYKALVIDQKIATAAGMSFQPQSYSSTIASLYAVPLPEIDLDTLHEAYQEQLRLVIKDGVSAQELLEAKIQMQDAAIYARDSLSGPAMIFGYGLATGSTIDDIEFWPRDIGAVSAADIQAVAQTYLNPDAPYIHPPVSGYLMPKTHNDAKEVIAQ